MHGQQYKTYLEWKRVGRQVRKGEHGQRDHLGETVFGLDQTDMIRSRRRIEQEDKWDKYSEHKRRFYNLADKYTDGDPDEDEAFREAYDPNY